METKQTQKLGAYEALKRNIDFIEIFGKVTGWQLICEWKGGLRHWITTFFLFFNWSQFIYSLLKFLMNGEVKRVLEVLSLFGISFSVISLAE